MNLVLFGPPGAGKGTQAQMICEKYLLTHLSTGDAIRKAIREKTPLGCEVADRVAHGELIPDDMVTGIVDEFISGHRNQTDSFLFDGYPRTLSQIEQLEGVLEKHRLTPVAVVSLEVPDTDLMERITRRRVCTQCRRTFNILMLDPKASDVCPVCQNGPTLVQRKDDTPETVEERLKVYHEQTAPVLHQYEMQGQLSTIDGTGTPEQVFERLCAILSEQY